MIARNSIPAIGVFWFDWPAALAIFQIWFDGVAALAAMFALQIRAFNRLDDTFAEVPSVVAWTFLMLLLGIPYWFMLLVMIGFLLPDQFWTQQVLNPVVVGALLFTLGSHFFEQARRGYDRMTEEEIRKEANWHVTLHIARAAVILTVTFLFTLKFLIAALAFALSYLEIYPMRSLRILGGDIALDNENENRSLD